MKNFSITAERAFFYCRAMKANHDFFKNKKFDAMSYWTNRDFVEPIREGNNRLPGAELFYTVHECRGYHVSEPANLGGLLGVVDSYDFRFDDEQKKLFIDQLKDISLEKAYQVLGVLDIAEYNELLEEVQNILLKKLTAAPVERADEWYMSVYRINCSLQHLRMHACGGAVNGSWWVTPKEDEDGEGEALIGGYYNFRNGHLSEEEAEKFKAFVSEWIGPNGEKEELFQKLF